jgi:hypothetical protein
MIIESVFNQHKGRRIAWLSSTWSCRVACLRPSTSWSGLGSGDHSLLPAHTTSAEEPWPWKVLCSCPLSSWIKRHTAV